MGTRSATMAATTAGADNPDSRLWPLGVHNTKVVLCWVDVQVLFSCFVIFVIGSVTVANQPQIQA